MKKFLALLVAIGGLGGCASDPVNRRYSGNDGGYLVYSIGRLREPADFVIYYRRDRQESGLFQDNGLLVYNSDKPFGNKPDFQDSTETGLVGTHYLEPGNYEIYSFDVTLRDVFQQTGSPMHNFSIPFTIRPGQITYIGDYNCVKMMGSDLFGNPVGASAYFVVSDKHVRDLTIAHNRDARLPATVTMAIPDVDRLKSPFFKTRP